MKTEPSTQKRRSSPLLLVALVGTALLVWLGRDRADAGSSPAQLPHIEAELFGEPSPCGAADTEGSRRRADLAERHAIAHRERAPFYPASGPAAVRFWTDAAACWSAAGEPERSEVAAAQGRALRARVLQDVRAHQLRLSRAKEKKQLAEALTETKALRTLFEGAPPARTTGSPDTLPSYAEWLVREERRLSVAQK
jgi:hypothetical protein